MKIAHYEYTKPFQATLIIGGRCTRTRRLDVIILRIFVRRFAIKITKQLPNIFAIVNSTGDAASVSSFKFGPLNLLNEVTVALLDSLVALSKTFKAAMTGDAVKFELLNEAGLPSIAPYSTIT